MYSKSAAKNCRFVMDFDFHSISALEMDKLRIWNPHRRSISTWIFPEACGWNFLESHPLLMLQIFPAENQHIHPMCIYPYKASHKGERHRILFTLGGLWRYCGSEELGIIQVVIRWSFSWRKRMNLTSVAQAALPTEGGKSKAMLTHGRFIARISSLTHSRYISILHFTFKYLTLSFYNQCDGQHCPLLHCTPSLTLAVYIPVPSWAILSQRWPYILKALHPVQGGPNKVVFQQPAPLWLHLPRHAGSYTSKRRSCKQYSYSIHIFD